MFRPPFLIATGHPTCSFEDAFAILGEREVVRTSPVSLSHALSKDMRAAGVDRDFSFMSCFNAFPEFETPQMTDREHELVRVFPQRLLVLSLISSMNYYAYVYYENGKKLRCMAGDTDEPVIIDWGDPLPEEQPYYDELAGDPARLATEGETLVLVVTTRVLPKPISNWCSDEGTMIDTYETKDATKRRGFLSRLFERP